jgi:uncharacterized protein (UPF0335 family)
VWKGAAEQRNDDLAALIAEVERLRDEGATHMADCSDREEW